MSRVSRWWRRLRRARRRVWLFGRWIGGDAPPVDFVDPIVPPDPYHGELGLSSDETDVIDTQANYVDIFVDRTNGYDGAVSVQYSLTPGSATAGVDYTDVSGTLSWLDGDQTAKSFRVPILSRSVSGDFDFTAQIDSPTGGALIVSGLDTCLVTIHRRGNGEANFAGSPYYKQNPDPAPSTTLTLQVQRNLAFKDAVSVNWHTVDGTAIAGTDYTAGSGTLTWVNGDGNPKSIVLTILGRAGGPFGDRNFTVVLDTPTGGIVIGSINPATVTLTDGVPPSNPSVTASIANQLCDEFYITDNDSLIGDDYALMNNNIMTADYVGSDVNGSVNNVDDFSLEDLLSIAVFLDSSVGIAVGTSGVVIRTADNGLTWFVPYSSVSVNLRGVTMASATVGWAVGDNGTILKTTDGGNSWVAQTSGTSENLYGVYAASTTVAFAVGTNGKILKTVDGGTNWVAKTSGVSVTLRGVILIGTTGWAVGHSGTVLKTVDTADTWSTQTSGTGEDLHSVWMRDATNVWACGTNGKIIKGDGTNWASQNSGGGHLHGIAMFSTTVGWAVGDGGVILKTTNGSTWSAQTSNTSKNLNAVCYTESGGNVIVAVGDDMTIDRTANAGTAWAPIVGPTIAIGPPSASIGGGIDFGNQDDTFYPTSRFSLSGMVK